MTRNRPAEGGATPGRAALGQRIQLVGNTNSGKSTLGARLARALAAPFVDLDALNFLPNWVALDQTDPEAFALRVSEATVGPAWVVAGSYTRFSQKLIWPRLESVIWLDLPLPQLVGRVVLRSWRRWRSAELLWGTNRERFWPRFALWRGGYSLLWWVLSQHARKRRQLAGCMADPKWRHVRFVRLTSSAEIEAFAVRVERDCARREAR
jgi:adenylate kinase family enzyme